MLFGNYNKNAQAQMLLDGVDIVSVLEYKFLDAIIADKLKWKSHIQQNLSRSISVEQNSYWTTNHKYMSIIRSLTVLQKRAIRKAHKNTEIHGSCFFLLLFEGGILNYIMFVFWSLS